MWDPNNSPDQEGQEGTDIPTNIENPSPAVDVSLPHSSSAPASTVIADITLSTLDKDGESLAPDTASGDASGEEDAVIEEELALLSSRHQPFCHLSSQTLNMANVEGEKPSSNASTTSTTPQPSTREDIEAIKQIDNTVDEETRKLNEKLEELSEEHDAFHIDAGQPRSLGALQTLSSFHRPIPIHVHCHCHSQGETGPSKSLSASPFQPGSHRTSSPILMHGSLQHHTSPIISHPRLQAVLSNPSSTPSSSGASSPALGMQPSSLPPQLNIPGHLSHSQHCHHLNSPMSSSNCSSPSFMSATASDDPSSGTSSSATQQIGDSRKGMSRSISDSTLRRAALHLNLNQSVLPSFTSLQQFKKEISLSSSTGSSGNRRHSTRKHRNSMIVQTSPTLPRCNSPSTNQVSSGANSLQPMGLNSPMDSPKVSPNQFAFANVKKADGRRWSVASLPSSGYGTTPGSSNVSSQCSSQERLHQIGIVGASAGIPVDGKIAKIANTDYQLATGLAAAAAAAAANNSLSGTPVPVAGPGVDDLRSFHRHFSSNESNPSLIDDEGRRSPSIRPRSRSLSLAYLCLASMDSPIRSPVIDNEIVMMNTLYKERFPKATKQMEERLKNFITNNSDTMTKTQTRGEEIAADSIAIVRFVHHQTIEMARDCLQKSEDKLITSRYFYEMSENLEKLLTQTREKSPDAASHLTALIKKLLLIVSRPARLLECLEFDPEEFYQLLEAAEGHARGLHGVSANVPQYIIGKLGLNRDPLAELQQDLSNLDTVDRPISCQMSEQTSNDYQNNQTQQTEEESSKSGCDCQVEASKNNSLSEEIQEETINKRNVEIKIGIKDPSENDFDIIKLISNGAYGAVYLVKHKETRQRFALKKINKQNLILRNQVDQVFAERDIMSFTDNPFVVSMYCSFETRKHLCMVMEYVEGGDCAILLKNMGPFPPDMARFYFAETVLAVEYLHSFGIVHRDLKPDNLLITALGHIKLTDFGLSKMGLMSLATNLYEGYIDKETKQFSDKQVFGTPEYIAPEVILRQGYGKPVDWWSAGIILYEFLIGCVPFFGETPEELFAHTVNDDIEWPQEDDWPVQPQAKQIITELLQQNPLERLGTQGAFELKEHDYFTGIDWNVLLRFKADFIPQLSDDEDTSYFDMRSERYNHELEDDICVADDTRSSAEDTDDTQSLFASFTSASPRYRKVHGSKDSIIEHRHSMSICDSSHSDQSDTSGISSNSFGHVRTASLSSGCGVSGKVSLSPELRRTKETNIIADSNESVSVEKSADISRNAANHMSCPDLETMIAKAGGLHIAGGANLSGGIPNRALEILDRNVSGSTSVASPSLKPITSSPLALNRVPTLSTPTSVVVSPCGGVTPSISRHANAAGPQSLQHSFSTPESSQTDSEDISPLLHRRNRSKALHGREPLPKFSIQMDEQAKAELKSKMHGARVPHIAATRSLESTLSGPRSLPVTPRLSVEPNTPSPLVTSSGGSHDKGSASSSRSRSSIVKSSSATGLSLMIPTGDCAQSIESPGGSSTASSRDASPCRDFSPLINSLNAPIIVRRGPRGFGFTIRAIRVYFGDTDFYTVHHLVMEVDRGSPAFDAGLRPGDLVTHINGESVQGLFHTQVLQLLMSGGDAVTLKATALESTSIKTGGRRRDPQAIKMARRAHLAASKHRSKNRKDPKHRKTSLFRKLSSKKATAEMQQLAAAGGVASLSSSQSLQSLRETTPNLMRSLPPNLMGNYNSTPSSCSTIRHMSDNSSSKTPNSATLSTASNQSPSGLVVHTGSSDSPPSDSCSSSPVDSMPCSPGTSGTTSPSARPSSLHGLKYKLHVKTKTPHSPNRRKSVGHIPLSPLARTPSPSPIPISPTRSPSPLALPSPLACHHVPGASNTTQTYSPGASLTPNSVTAKKSSFNRPKSAEPGSPLLRRALSPDRLHPPRCSNVDGKKNTTISPLCSPSCKVVVSTTPKLTISTQMSPQGVSHVGHKSGEVSPLPSRALHTSPLASSVVDNRESGDQQGNVLLRKHSKQSLSQPTIPEEGPEHAEEEQNSSSIMSSLPPLDISTGSIAPHPQATHSDTPTLKPKPESRAVKILAQELLTEKGVTRKDNLAVKKSSSFRSETKSKSVSPVSIESTSTTPHASNKNESSLSQDVTAQITKSPKVSRHESMERTVQRITKVIRGTSRSESRSKKNRETSTSPSKGATCKPEQHECSIKTNQATGTSNSGGSKSNKKESGKKNAHEKREIFKSLH